MSQRAALGPAQIWPGPGERERCLEERRAESGWQAPAVERVGHPATRSGAAVAYLRALGGQATSLAAGPSFFGAPRSLRPSTHPFPLWLAAHENAGEARRACPSHQALVFDARALALLALLRAHIPQDFLLIKSPPRCTVSIYRRG